MLRKYLAFPAGLFVFAVSTFGQSTAPGLPPSGPGPATATPTETAQAAGTGPGQLQQITVTGYIVPRVGEGAQPVVSLDRNFVERQGNQTVSDVLQRLPNNVSSFTPFVNAGATFSPGASEVNLNGLGTNSTLVLIDGRRQTTFPFPQNGFQSFVDLNSIPLAAVDRIEVLKDGASATYGSDAIAGVVNVILKDEYNGADINNYFGISQRGDYQVEHVQLTGGIAKNLSDTSKFSILAAFDYYNQSPIDAIDRANSSNVNHLPRLPNDGSDLRSNSAPAGHFFGDDGNTYQVTPGNAGSAVLGTSLLVNPDATEQYNTVPGVQLVPREERYGGLLKINYQPIQYLRIYDEFSAQHNKELASFTATPVTNTDFINVPPNNPFNPTGANLDSRLRLLEFGQRKTETDVTNVRNVVGVSLINLPKNWFVDASFLWAQTEGETQGFNAIRKSRLQEALNGTLPGFEGQFYNPFLDYSAVRAANPQFINALRFATDDHARTNLTQWQIKAGGELIDVPAGPITAGVGAEYRSTEYIDYKDLPSRFGDVVAQGGKGNASGKDYDRAAYGELTIPLLGGKWSFPGARVLEFVLAERYDDYSSFGEAWKPKFSVRYKPFDDLTLRASYSEGFRAPTVTELFGSQLASFTFVRDPVLGTQPEVELLASGNPNLQPETSYGYYAGAVWTPGSTDPDHSWWGWANGFTAYVDWVEILKRGTIQQIDPQFVVNNADLFPGAVVRGPGGVITSVADPLENLGAIRVDSFQFGGSYVTKEFSWGKLDAECNASYFYHVSEQNTIGGQVIDVTNSLAAVVPVVPDFKLVASLFYTKTLFNTDTFSTGVTLNYYDSYHDANDFRGLGLTLQDFVNEFGLTQVHTVGSWTTFDWQISYEFGKPPPITPETPKPGYDKEGKPIVGEKAILPKSEGSEAGWRKLIAGTKIVFGINNIFDTRAPFVDTFTEGYDTATANPIQRYFYVSVEKKF
jgi:iron complex outermembrane recepter protein